VTFAPRPPTPDAWVSGDGSTVAVRSAREAVLFRPDVKLFGAELWARRRGLDPSGGAELRDLAYDCDHWSCAAKPGAPVAIAAAWNVKRPLAPGRLDALCASAELIVLRDHFQPGTCPGKLVLSGEDFERGGSAELFRQPDGSWKALWAQDLRGRRPWSWQPR
jgi:competence protein ComEC